MGVWERKLERPAYGVCPCVGEWWNTVSNVLFVVLGLYRLCVDGVADPRLHWLYVLYTCAGVGSAIHHACAHIPGNRWSIYVDWLPISASILSILLGTGTLALVMTSISARSIAMLLLALATLISDHVSTPIPVPWGHCLWHVAAAIAIDATYQDCIAAIPPIH